MNFEFQVNPTKLEINALPLQIWLVNQREKDLNLHRCLRVRADWSRHMLEMLECPAAAFSYYSKNVVKLESPEKHLLELREGFKLQNKDRSNGSNNHQGNY